MSSRVYIGIIRRFEEERGGGGGGGTMFRYNTKHNLGVRRVTATCVHVRVSGIILTIQYY